MNQYYRPQIQNGRIVPRPRPAFPPAAASRQAAAARPMTVIKDHLRSQSRLAVGLIGCGALIASGFVFGLHQHFTAYAVDRKEVKLRSQLDQSAAQSRDLNAQQGRARSPQQIEQAARANGLRELQLDTPVAAHIKAKRSTRQRDAGESLVD